MYMDFSKINLAVLKKNAILFCAGKFFLQVIAYEIDNPLKVFRITSIL